MRLSLKILFILLLASAIFGGAWYFTYNLFIRPEKALQSEQKQPAPPPPPDPTIPDFEKAIEPKTRGKWLEARTALEDFVDHNAESTKINEARAALGEVNTRIYLTPIPAPEKQSYIVRPLDTINKVSAHTHCTPELIMKANQLKSTLLRVNQKLLIPPMGFSVIISRKREKVILQRNARFFKEYTIRSWPSQTAKKVPPGPQPKVVGRVADKVAWFEGQRIPMNDKNYGQALHWIQTSIPNYTLYGEPPPGDTKAQKPAAGVALPPEALPELAVLLRKNDPVTIE